MLQKKFAEWLEEMEQTTVQQLEKVRSRLSAVVARRHAEGTLCPRPEIPAALTDAVASTCPHCGHKVLKKNGFASGLQRWQCGKCGRTFNILTKTPLARLRKKEKWLVNAQAMIDGVTIVKAAKRCEVSTSTTFRWRHRFATLLGHAQCKELSGIAECDIKQFYDSEKGNRNLNRKPRKHGGDGIEKGSAQLVSVITMQDRNGNGAERVAVRKPRIHAYDLFTVNLKSDALLLTDGDKNLGAAYKDVCAAADDRNPDGHRSLVGQEKARGKKGDPFHIQTVNAFHSHLERWIARFHGVNTSYLGNYVGWYRQLKENHFKDDPNLFIRLAFQPLSLNPKFVIT